MIEIYALLDADESPRYVGQSRCAQKRFCWHLGVARRGQQGRVYNWIRSVFAEAATPTLRILETCDALLADERESAWISKFLLAGIDLTNCTLGGGGIRGWRHTEETKAKIGAVHRGKVLSLEARLQISQRMRGKKLSAAHKENIGRAGLGRLVSAQTRLAISKRMLGNTYGLGTKMSTATLARRKSLRGENSVSAKTTNDTAVEMRELFASGVRQVDIARIFGLDPVTTHRILRHKTYVVTAVGLQE